MQHFWEVMGKESGIIRKAYDVLEAHHWTAEELQQYERMEKINMDAQAKMAYAEELVEARGEAQAKIFSAITKSAAILSESCVSVID